MCTVDDSGSVCEMAFKNRQWSIGIFRETALDFIVVASQMCLVARRQSSLHLLLLLTILASASMRHFLINTNYFPVHSYNMRHLEPKTRCSMIST
jgi:hypothetical protein